jgi:hypothetical protein
MAPVPRTLNAPLFDPSQYQSSHSSRNRLPEPVELANRLEEARTSAKLLEQVVACTPPSEVLSNELIKEFADRCHSASRSIQGYMAAEDPAPDNDTMENLIDTNEQLQQALNQHHRAVLQAKKHLGVGDSSRSSNNSSPAPPLQGGSQRQLPSPPASAQSPSRALPAARKAVAGSSSGNGGSGGSYDRNGYGNGNGTGNGKGKAALDPYYNESSSSAIAGPSRSTSATPRHHDENTDDDDGQDPFRDPAPKSSGDSPPRLSYEPYHPGFSAGDTGGGSSSAGGAGEAGGSRSRAQHEAASVSDYDETSPDTYGATPRDGGGHVYRY